MNVKTEPGNQSDSKWSEFVYLLRRKRETDDRVQPIMAECMYRVEKKKLSQVDR